MKKGKLLAVILSVMMLFGVGAALAGCGGDVSAESKIFRIVSLKGGRGSEYILQLKQMFLEKYKDDYKDITVEVHSFPGATISTEVTNMINSGKHPDLLFMNLGATNAPVEKFIKDKQVVDVSDVLKMSAPGETAKVGDKLVGNILNNYTCQPYGNGKTYLLPAFYSPTGLFYDASKYYTGATAVAEKKKLPTTFEEFFARGEALKNDGNDNTNLFTYPTAGYFDSYLYAAIAAMAGEEKFNKALGYADGIWEDADIKAALTQVVKLKSYLLGTTIANANDTDFKKNQQAVIDGTADFMPNGDWVIGEMAATTPSEFEWGVMPVPKKDANSKAYTNTYIETMFIHTSSDNQDMAKKFMAMYYGKDGAKVVANEAEAIIPTNEAVSEAKTNGISDDIIAIYDMYKSASAVVGNFAATTPVNDVNWTNILFKTSIDEAFKSDKDVSILVNEWSAKLEAASDKLRAAIIK